MARLALFGIMVFWAALSLVSCSGKQTRGDTAEALYSEAQEAFKDENFLLAREKYRTLKNRFPYSSRAIDSELRIADSYFEEESYIEAASAYEVFRELHPTHSQRDYVQYRVALSYFHQIPDNTARDLSAAFRSISEFEMVLSKFSGSKFVTRAKKFLVAARKKLAEHESYVANFYFQRRHYLSSSYRYASLLKDYPDLGYDEQALYRLGQCYYHIRMYGNAKDALRQLVKKFPSGKHRGDAGALLEKIEKATN